MRRETPGGAREVAAVLAAAAPGAGVRVVGGGTKLAWGRPGPEPALELSTARLDALLEHNAGDLTAVLGAGLPLAAAQEAFAQVGQRLCLDPPDPGGATVGGVIASGDSGPLRHRYGAPRDLVLGVQVALPDGTVARAGSKVIKNVAGYDLAKLMCGALGTLGVVCEVTVRLHPLPEASATAVGRGAGASVLAGAARALAALPLELEALDLRWEGGEGALLARAGGRSAQERARAAGSAMVGLAVEIVEDDDELWAAQRAAQRPRDPEHEAIVRVSARPSELEDVLRAAPRAVARAGLGLAWVTLPAEPEAVSELRARLAGAACVVLDAPAALRAAVDPWGVEEGPALTLMRRVKERFDPGAVCNPGRYAGGI